MNEHDNVSSLLREAAEALQVHFKNKAESFPPDQRNAVDNAISDLLEAVGTAETEGKALLQLEHKLEQIQDETPSNVIQLRRTVKPATAFSVSDKRWMLRLDCLIEGKNISEIHKMALELHSHSRRYAFMEFQSLSPSARQNFEELMSLGGISLFVPDILKLSAAEQSALQQLVEQDTIHRPLLMAGSTMPYFELRCEERINIDLLLSLSRAYIRLTRPFAEYKQKGLIHYFLDSLSQSPT